MIHLGWMSLPVTVLWIVVITNAINLTDGLDGLAAGTGILISLTLLVVTGNKDPVLGLTLVILIGSLLGFLRHNFPPATIFMGDSGSLFTGFVLGSYTIVSSAKATAMATVMLPILAFGLPLLDMSYAVLRRYHRGVPLAEADKEHIHHKLLDMGLSKRKVLLTLYAGNLLILGVIVLFVSRHLRLHYLGLGLLAVAAVAGLHRLGYLELTSLAKNNVRTYRLNRKRRYFTFVIGVFEKSVRKIASREELEEHLMRLFRHYRFGSVRIYLDGEGEGSPAYEYIDDEVEEAPIRLALPIGGDGSPSGRVVLQAQGDEGSLTCASELVRVLTVTLASRLSLLEPEPGSGVEP